MAEHKPKLRLDVKIAEHTFSADGAPEQVHIEFQVFKQLVQSSIDGSLDSAAKVIEEERKDP